MLPKYERPVSMIYVIPLLSLRTQKKEIMKSQKIFGARINLISINADFITRNGA